MSIGSPELQEADAVVIRVALQQSLLQTLACCPTWQALSLWCLQEGTKNQPEIFLPEVFC